MDISEALARLAGVFGVAAFLIGMFWTLPIGLEALSRRSAKASVVTLVSFSLLTLALTVASILSQVRL